MFLVSYIIVNREIKHEMFKKLKFELKSIEYIWMYLDIWLKFI